MQIRKNFSAEHEKLLSDLIACTRCKLRDSCDRTVLWRGTYDIPVVLVGEAPGAEENYSGVPFVGDSGVLLERALASVGWDSSNMYVTNALKCRPENNRTPTTTESKYCSSHYLWIELYLLSLYVKKPALIITLGLTASNVFKRCKSMKDASGKIIIVESPKTLQFNGEILPQHTYSVMPTYHPSACIRTPTLDTGSAKYKLWQNLITAKDYVESTLSEREH